jgi:hypothetical protein
MSGGGVVKRDRSVGKQGMWIQLFAVLFIINVSRLFGIWVGSV